MKHNLATTAPSYFPTAKPTPKGWVNPATGELLHAIKLDMSLFADTTEAVTVDLSKTDSSENVADEPATKANKKRATKAE